MGVPKTIRLALAVCLSLWGCGYQMTGHGTSQLPANLKTIAIPVFENSSAEPAIQRPFTEALRRAFITDGRLRLMNDQQKADLVMTGTITSYSISAVAFNLQDVAIEYWVTIGARVEVKDRLKDQIYLKQNVNSRWDYIADDSVINSEASRQAALVQAFRVMSQRLVSLVNDKF